MRNISFAMTTQQVRDRTKTVTRRMGWADLKQGELLCAIVKGQGLRKGEKIERLATIRVCDVRREFLDRMTADLDYGFEETKCEGFPEPHPCHWPSEFVAHFCASHKGCKPDSMVTRIEFEYVDGEPLPCSSQPPPHPGRTSRSREGGNEHEIPPTDSHALPRRTRFWVGRVLCVAPDPTGTGRMGMA